MRYCWGIRLPHARTGGVLIFAQRRVKHTETQYLTWFGKTAYIHGKESILFRDRERITTQYMEEEDHFTLLYSQLSLLHLQLLQWQQGCCHCSSLFLSTLLHTLTFSLHGLLCSLAAYLWARMVPQLQLFFNKGGCTWVAPFCQWLVQLPLTMATLSS